MTAVTTIVAAPAQRRTASEPGPASAVATLARRRLLLSIRTPRELLVPVMAVGMAAIFFAYLLQRAALPKLAAVALSTAKSDIAQPLYVILMGAGIFLLIVFVFLSLLMGWATATECAAWGVLGSLAIAWWQGALTRLESGDTAIAQQLLADAFTRFNHIMRHHVAASMLSPPCVSE